MRAILDFLATVLAVMTSHLGGGDLIAPKGDVLASQSTPTTIERAAQPFDLTPNVVGAMSGLPLSYLVVDAPAPRSMGIVKYRRGSKPRATDHASFDALKYAPELQARVWSKLEEAWKIEPEINGIRMTDAEPIVVFGSE